ncbi:hypothetical protein SAMN05518672_103681 [Chitinophaga sp. CF118]|nr:hypothetical protein SAMN05518672_103681 [Chitinophaga sp. CF118]
MPCPCLCPCAGPSAWFEFMPSNIDVDAEYDPLNYKIFQDTPAYIAGGQHLRFIYACIKIVDNLQRPVICEEMCKEIQAVLYKHVYSSNIITGS